MVAIYDDHFRKNFRCGGSLLNSSFVLTAAHCLYDPETLTLIPQLNISAGAHNKSKKDHHWQERKVIRHFIHPEFNTSEYNNDIALLELEYPLAFNERVQPALLPEEGEELELGSKATVIGWGKTESSYWSDVLLEVQVPIADSELCQADQRLICAGTDGLGTCYGDSGGPLMVEKEDNQWYVFGITSRSTNKNELHPLCGVGVGGAYTKTSVFIDWITNKQPGGWKNFS